MPVLAAAATAHGPGSSGCDSRQHRSIHRDGLYPAGQGRVERRGSENVDGGQRHQRERTTREPVD